MIIIFILMCVVCIVWYIRYPSIYIDALLFRENDTFFSIGLWLYMSIGILGTFSILLS